MKLLILLGVAFCAAVVTAKPAFLWKQAKMMEKAPQIAHSGESLASVKILSSASTKSADGAFPDHLPVALTTSEGRLHLMLTKNMRIDMNKVNVRFGSQRVYQRKGLNSKSYYRDQRSGAAITVKYAGGKHTFEGTLFSGGKRYTLQSAVKSSFSDKTLTLLQALEATDLGLHSLKEEDLKLEFGHPAEQPEVKKIVVHHGNIKGRVHVDPQTFNDTHDADSFRVKRDTENKVKRASGTETNFHIEMVMVLDYTVYEKFMEMNNNDDDDATEEMLSYYAHTFNGISLAYDSIEATYSAYSITPWLNDIYICDTVSSSSITTVAISAETNNIAGPEDYTLDGTTFFNNVWTWKEANGYTWSNPDHLMVFTMYDISGDSTIGMAPVGQICGGSGSWGGVSINEDIGLHTWAVAAHEMGHNLGSSHDGSGNSCSGSDQYIMASSVSSLSEATASNAYTFSVCSVSAMLNELMGNTDGYPKTCTHNTICDHGEPLDLSETLAGQLYGEDEQCSFMFEGNYHYDDGFCMSDTEDVCQSLKCRNGNTYSCSWKYPAADGTPCGSNKWCRSGDCVTIGSVGDLSDQTCSIIDHSVEVSDCADTEDFTFPITYNGVYMTPTCTEIVQQSPEWCFSFDSVASDCDYSCQTHGLYYDGAECTAPGACSGDVPGVYFNGGVSCSQAASYGWCSYSIVVQYCCASCS